MTSEGKKNWERPWSNEEIVEHADNWNLACDAALLNTLQEFGDKILKRAEQVHEKIDKLCDNLDKTSLRVDLARNEFNSLRNSQFMECRVYEEDETLPTEIKEEKKTETDVPKEETMNDLCEAVTLGLDVLHKYYDKVEVEVSDSEDDDDENIPSYVYRRKDLYINRRLPHIIGSEEWYKKWHVGLQESSDSENEKSASDKFSESDDEDYQIKEHSDVSSELNLSSLNNNLQGQPVAVSTANTTLHNDEFLASQVQRGATFAEQLAEKLGNVIRENGILVETDEVVNQRPIQKKNDNYGALFSNEPPPLVDDILKERETDGIFSGGKGLFDDDEEDDDDLWNPVKPKSFETSQYKKPKSIQEKGIFDDEENSDESDIFSPPKEPFKQPFLISNKPTVPFFNEEPPVLKTEPKDKKGPIGGVSLFGNVDLFAEQKIGNLLKGKHQNDSSDDENTQIPSKNRDESISSKLDKTLSNKASIESDEDDFFTAINQTESKKDKISSLFNESLNDDSFDFFKPKIEEKHDGSLVKQKISVETPKTTSEVKKKVELSLFDDEFDEVDDLFSEILKNPKPKLPENASVETSSKPDEKHVNMSLEPGKPALHSVEKEQSKNVQFESSSTVQSVNIPNINFFDSTPPPEDIWENNDSDNNNIDDSEPYSEVFQSQASSLFDNEPPSLLFNNTSGIVADQRSNRIDSISNSFDPSLTSSRRLSSEMFSENQINDSSLLTKNEIQKRRLERTEEVYNSDDFTDITPSGNLDELYSESDIKQNSLDALDDASLVVQDKNDIIDKIYENNDKKRGGIEKIQESDEMNQKVTEFADKFQNEPEIRNEKSNNNPVPKKLRHSLNINVGALLPGSAPPKRDKQHSPEKDDEIPASTLDKNTLKSVPILRPKSEGDVKSEMSKSISFEDDSNVEILKSITKNRARIPIKRKPSTKRGRQKLLRNSSTEHFTPNNEHEDEKDLIEKDLFDDELVSPEENAPVENAKIEIASSFSEVELKDSSKENENLSIFEDQDDLFNTTKKVETKTKPNTKITLFNDDDDDIFDVKNDRETLFREQKSRNLFDSSDENADENSSKNTNVSLNKPSESSSSDVEKSLIPKRKIESLFNESDEETSSKTDNSLFPEHENERLSSKSEESSSKIEKSLFSERKTESLFNESDDSEDVFSNSSSGARGISITGNAESKSKKNEKTAKLFDSSDEDDDFLKSLRKDKVEVKPQKNDSVPKRVASLFDDDEDDIEDIFGTLSDKTSTKKEVQQAVIKKQPKSGNLRKINIEGDYDPLSAMLK